MDSLLEFIRVDLGNPGLALLLSNPSFAFIQLMNSISMGMYLFTIAAGLSLIFGVLKVINFAHGACYMFGAYIVYSVTQQAGLNFWLGILAAGVGLTLLSIIIERGLFQFLYDKEHLMQLLLTFAVVLILGWMRKLREERMQGAALALILGGAVGNLYDRVVLGHVVDFLDFYWGDYHFPAFNIADTAITIGAALIILDMLLGGRRGHD